MQPRTKKPNKILIVIGFIFALLLGYLSGRACGPGITIFQFYERFQKVIKDPFHMYWNAYTIKSILFCSVTYLLVVLIYYTSQRNLMPGKEYGTAKLIEPQILHKTLHDERPAKNRILSHNIRMSMDFRKLKLNGNILICGGSGAGKTFYFVKPNLMEMPEKCSFVITDPKSEILRATGNMLEKNGYQIKVVNLLEMEKSNHYNPFCYIREETDVIKLITNLIANTTPKGSNPSDPFWQQSEGLFLQSLFYYIWLELPKEEQNFRTVLKLLADAKVPENKKDSSKLDKLMGQLELEKGSDHPAVRQYNRCMRGAADTVRSIIISANARLAFLQNENVLKLLDYDDLNIAELGAGKNGDGQTKTALYCVIPDSDKSYNFIIGMLYSQIFQELYYQADFVYGGRLPLHVTFMLDEFANVALPDDFCSLLSTMRSREISSIIIIQNFAQIKALFKDTWETIPGNCDTFLYLGGNEQSTWEYVSKLLGKSTIDKKSSGETKGRQGSSSRNYDVLGREIFTPDEVGMLDNKKCIIKVRGLNPCVDAKYVPFGHPNFSQTEDGGAKPYVHRTSRGGEKEKTPRRTFEILTPESLQYYEKQKEKGENVLIVDISYDELTAISEFEFDRKLHLAEEKKMVQDYNESEEYEVTYAKDKEEEETFGQNVQNRMMEQIKTEQNKEPALLEEILNGNLPDEQVSIFCEAIESKNFEESFFRELLESRLSTEELKKKMEEKRNQPLDNSSKSET